jgi:hypothetical protein
MMRRGLNENNIMHKAYAARDLLKAKNLFEKMVICKVYPNSDKPTVARLPLEGRWTQISRI